MKTKVYLFCFLIAAFACTKENSTFQQTGTTSADKSSSEKSRSALLTAHDWMYQGLYFHYVSKSNKGDVQYERGGSSNIIDLDNTVFHFKANGNFVEYENGNTYPGTWTFTNSADTTLILDYTYWKDAAAIINFSKERLNFTEPMGYKSKSYTELLPAE